MSPAKSQPGPDVAATRRFPIVEYVETSDLDEHAAAQTGWTLQYQQLSEGEFRGEFLKVDLPALSLARERCSVALRQRGRLNDDVYGFATALEPTDALRFNGLSVPSDGLMCGKGDEIDMVTPPGFTLLALVVPRATLGPLWQRMHQAPLASWLDRQVVVSGGDGKLAGLRALHEQAMQQLRSLDLASWSEPALTRLRDDLLIEWLEAIPPTLDLRELASHERRKRLVDRACEMMMSRAEEPPTILQVCSHLGTSRRKLNYCFQDILGTTPVKYLRALRLNAARRALRAANASTSVQDVAATCGFWHLSQFGQDYKQLFGELPSATLRKAAAC